VRVSEGVAGEAVLQRGLVRERVGGSTVLCGKVDCQPALTPVVEPRLVTSSFDGGPRRGKVCDQRLLSVNAARRVVESREGFGVLLPALWETVFTIEWSDERESRLGEVAASVMADGFRGFAEQAGPGVFMEVLHDSRACDCAAATDVAAGKVLPALCLGSV
jgi:hypothetical protein